MYYSVGILSRAQHHGSGAFSGRRPYRPPSKSVKHLLRRNGVLVRRPSAFAARLISPILGSEFASICFGGIAVLEALGLENSPARVRVLLSSVMIGAKLLETGELADQLAAIKGVLEARLPARKARR